MRKPDVRAAPAPRLQFTQEELNTPELKKPLRKAQKAADKRDAARAKLPQQKKLLRQVSADPTTGKLSTRLTFESTTKPPSKLHHEMSDVTSAEVHQIMSFPSVALMTSIVFSIASAKPQEKDSGCELSLHDM